MVAFFYMQSYVTNLALATPTIYVLLLNVSFVCTQVLSLGKAGLAQQPSWRNWHQLTHQVNDVTNDQLPISITPEPIDRFFSDLKTRSLRSYIFLSILRAQKFRLKDFELLSCNGLKTSLSNDSVLIYQKNKRQTNSAIPTVQNVHTNRATTTLKQEHIQA